MSWPWPPWVFFFSMVAVVITSFNLGVQMTNLFVGFDNSNREGECQRLIQIIHHNAWSSVNISNQEMLKVLEPRFAKLEQVQSSANPDMLNTLAPLAEQFKTLAADYENLLKIIKVHTSSDPVKISSTDILNALEPRFAKLEEYLKKLADQNQRSNSDYEEFMKIIKDCTSSDPVKISSTDILNALEPLFAKLEEMLAARVEKSNSGHRSYTTN